MSTIRGVFFDMGGVLCRVDETRVWQAWHEHTGIPGEELRLELYERGLKHEFDVGLKHPSGVALFLATRWEIELTSADWRRIWGLAVEADPVANTLATEIASVLPCALASTTDPVHHQKLKPELPCLNAFKTEVVSYNVGFAKPHASFYRAALNALGTEAAETLFIDDREENVRGAMAAGMQAVRFTGVEDLRAEFARRGLG